MAEDRSNTTNTQTAVSDLTAEGDISFGDVNQVINNTHQYFQKANAFIKRSTLDEYIEPCFPTLNDEGILISNLKARKLLLIGGSHEDKPELGLHVAAKLAQQLVSNSDDKSNSTFSESILEFDCYTDSQVPLSEIHEGTTNGEDFSFQIFVLDNLEPRFLNFSIRKLLNAAESGRSYVIALTDSPKKTWNFESSLNDLWFEPQDDLYESRSLVKSLSIKIDQIASDDFLLKSDTQEHIKEAAAHTLKTFAGISRFARLISAQDKEISHDEVHELALAAKDSRHSLQEWYQAIDDREKLLSIGLSLFDGLFEDQFFAALEQIVVNVWQERDPSLRALDYYDLKNFDNHFKFEHDKDYILFDLKKPKVLEITEYAKKIRVLRSKIIRPSEKLTLIEIAWENYRRQIFSALKVIVELVETSAVPKSKEAQSNWELYGDQSRRRKLREVLSETLGNLCLVSADTSGAVQGALRQLAKNGSSEVRDVAAKAIAHWYQIGCQRSNNSNVNTSELVLGTLQRFYNDALLLEEELNPRKRKASSLVSYVDVTEDGKKSDSKSNKRKPLEKDNRSKIMDFVSRFFALLKDKKLDSDDQDYYMSEAWKYVESSVGATVSLSVGHISRIDYSRNGDEEISKISLLWLEELLESRVPLIHATLGYQTLAEIFPIYLDSLLATGFLNKAIQTHKDESLLNEGIALSLAKAYSEPPERLDRNRSEIKDLLSNWYRECQEERPKKIDTNKNTYHDLLLKVVALTYGNIKYDDEPTIQVDEGFEKLSEILDRGEKHPKVRRAVTFSVCKIARLYFDQVYAQLKALLPKMTISEQDEVIKSLLELHESQLSDSQEIGNIQTEQLSYKVWLVKNGAVLDDDKRQKLLKELTMQRQGELTSNVGKFKEIELNDKEYKLYLGNEQPLTETQKILFPWVKDEKNPTSQQVSLRFFSSLERKS